MAGYYKIIKGKKYDAELIGLADRATRGRGDGRISLSDARALVKKVKDSGEYSDIEKRTMAYIRDNYTFTPEADQWFRTQIRSWAAIKGREGKKRAPAPRTKAKIAKAAATSFEEEPIRQDEEDQEFRSVRSGSAQEKKSGWVWKIILLLVLAVLAVLAFFKFEQIKQCIQRGIDAFSSSKGETTGIAEKKEEEGALQIPGKQEAATPAAEEKGDYYLIEPKDSLVSIAEKLTGDYRDWVAIYNANKDTIKNPVLIFPRHRLRIPEELKGKLKR